MDARSCTCHPDDNPPWPCQRKFALSECRRARLREMIAEKDRARGRPLTPTEQLNNLEDALGIWMLSHGFNVPSGDFDEMLAALTTQFAERDNLSVASLVWAQAEAKLSNAMLANSLATGHGETFDELLRELEWQIKELRVRNQQ